MDNAKMTDANMAQREKIVKSMKKNFKNFRSRYGSDAKNVMYATATKMAMKEEETIEEGEVKKANKEKKNEYVSSIIQKKLHPSVLPSKAYGRRKLKEETSEEKGEYDYEGDMAKSSLKTIIRNAQMMHDMLSDDTNLPEWVQSKITLAEDYIVSATQYMQSEMKEEVELDEISQKTKDSYVAKRGSQLSSMMHGSSKNYNLLSGKKQAKAVKGIKQALNKEEVELDEISKETAWKATEKAHTKVTKSAYGAIGDREPYLSKFKKNLKQEKKFSDYYKKKKAMGEANLTPYRNTELGVRSSKRAGQPRASNSRQFFRPPEGFTKKGIEKGKGKITVPVYKKKK